MDLLIANVEKTIALTEGRITMTDQEKFEGFKQNMTEEESNEMTRLANEVMSTLAEAFKTGDPAGHVDDERFTAFYDAN